MYGNSSDRVISMVGEIWRVLRPRGIFMLVSHNAYRFELLDQAIHVHDEGMANWECLEVRQCRLSPQGTLINILRSKLKGRPLSSALRDEAMLTEAVKEARQALKHLSCIEAFR